MRRIMNLACFLFSVILISSCSDTKQTERLFQHFINRHVDRIRPINKKYNEAVWATYSGKSTFSDLFAESQVTDSLYKLAGKPAEYYQNLLDNVYDNTSDFEVLMKIKNSGLISDTIMKRQFHKILMQYITIHNNWDETDRKKADLFEQFFELKKNESAFWDSIKQVENSDPRSEWIDQFVRLTDDFREMIKSMNRDAKQLGYSNYFQLIMDFNEIDYKLIDDITGIIEKETRKDYSDLLEICKEDITKTFNINAEDAGSQYYNYTINKMVVPKKWRKEYTHDEVKNIIKEFFAYGNFDIEAIWDSSDVWYDVKKFNQSFFFCSDVEERNYRIYANTCPTTYGVYNLFHEFGHAVHYQSVDKDVPYLLKDPHIISTEAVAIYFNDKLYHSPSLRKIMELPDSIDSEYYKAFADPTRLIFLRKLIRTIQFEKSIFENPDQDFNELWWSLNEKYLLYKTKEEDRLPEWISNQHIINVSGIHVNYLFAFAISAQLEAYFPNDIIGPIRGFMRHGDSMSWDQLLQYTTGEKLNLSYLFNSYKWKNKITTPISFEIKSSGGLSLYERFNIEDMENNNIVTISS